MKRVLVLLTGTIVLAFTGCAGVKVNTQATTDCLVACLNEPIYVLDENGNTVRIIPSEYTKLIYNAEDGVLELKDKVK